MASSFVEGKTVWFQKEITLTEKSKGCHLLDKEILESLSEIKSIKVGTAHIFNPYNWSCVPMNVESIISHLSPRYITTIAMGSFMFYPFGNGTSTWTTADGTRLYFLVKHTTASLILCENWDSEVRADMKMVLDKLIPESWNYTHSYEGPDDMPGHAKCALLGSSVTLPITRGKFNRGSWQGLWLCEHRYHGGRRKLVITINGCV